MSEENAVQQNVKFVVEGYARFNAGERVPELWFFTPDAEYHAAREQQGFIEGRIGEIEAKLSTAEVIDTASLNNTGKVIFGATVDLENQDDGKRISYQIVGEDEADIKTGRISITSPIARAIVGKSVGDVVDVVAPGGKHSYEVMVVRYV